MENGSNSSSSSSSSSNNNNNMVVVIYPLSHYYFGSKEALPDKEEDSFTERIQRMRSNYAAHGLRTCVQGVLLVELYQQPHVLLLQVRNSFFKLPGGRLRPGESDIGGLKRKLSRKLLHSGSDSSSDWEIGECIGMWWRSDFETLPCPYLPRKAKECTKLFLVRLQMTQKFAVPKNMRLLAVPLCQLYDNDKTYGTIISGLPQLLSKFSFTIVRE
ncbi:pre-mRNA cleavage factor Im 25 kDa subunit 1 [Iris pallida]|uniref:Pre-mRNA cleavage factor Im 25 kDa subunit n=1 Tax=Iris pallida TaxID=29817 RepID=A0AAX6EGI1_IRIPA|nr:pre-mRNA cleavage factor Im 25 kDa subunit 1 [Iris pallida]